ncbi:MAG: hypothetical protein ACREFC_13355, partial [Stellaceae bacterium]
QQYQLQHFVTDFYRAPVAIDHIGLITYRNPFYVLDLYGGGSEAASRAIVAKGQLDWMERLTDEHGIGLAMIYPNLDPKLPAAWREVGRMTLAGRGHTVAGRSVIFFAVHDSDRARIVRSLLQFEPTLPSGVSLSFAP